jgi:type IV secretion system protein VirB9
MTVYKFLFVLLLTVFVSAFGNSAYALRESHAMQVDHRVHTVAYQPDEVFVFVGHYRFQSAIEFGKDEEIKTISMGDSTAWMLNPSGNRLFLKPIEQDATTNMTIITNKHTYLMELHAREAADIDDKDMVFIMRFIYPEDSANEAVSQYLDNAPEPDLSKDASKYNFNYTIAGSDETSPIKIFDDGEFTYFQFRDKNTEVPAFFMVDDQGNEALINYRTRGTYIIVERVATRFTLRHGGDIVCVFNEAALAKKNKDSGWFSSSQ